MQSHCELYIIAKQLLDDFHSVSQINYEIVHEINGSDLNNCTYQHPIFKEQETLPFYASNHVQSTKGTGLVHTAPAHGPEDFLVSLEHKLSVKCFVNEDGIYTKDAPEFLRNKSVLQDGDTLVMKYIEDAIVYASKFTHSYPIDWRTKRPVIIRASEQWFMNTDNIKQHALEEIEKIEIYPHVNAEVTKNALATQVQKRPYWCISRQRAWGVPIPVFYEKQTGKVILNRKILSHICNTLEKEGNIDFWWSKTVQELLPADILSELGLNPNDLMKGADIFDIWFDSGSTWANVLQNNQIADLYLEGYDQFTGWFQSSLLTSVAARNHAPYKALFVHGFTVDEKGYKMSKSLGNVISPIDITKKYGVDVLRWWVASHGTQNMSITVSDKLLQQCAESVNKLRSVLRYLNGAIGEKGKHNINLEGQIHLNKYLLSNLVDFENEVQKSYDSYEYNRVVAQIQNFVANQISAVYIHLIKDRLYCGADDDLASIRFTLTKSYEILCKALWPITPFLVEESWSYYDAAHGFYEDKIKANAVWKDNEVDQIVNTALIVKRLINQNSNDVNTWNLAVNIKCSSPFKHKILQNLQPVLDTPISNSELCEILQVGQATLTSCTEHAESVDFSIELKTLDIILCPRCRRFAVENDDCTCVRCTNVLNAK